MDKAHGKPARTALGLGAGLLLGIAAGPGTAAERTVGIDAMQFASPTMTVKRGDRVVWTNRDLVPHTATSANRFDSGVIPPGKSWAFVAKEPGRYEYVCTLHPTMKAMLVVE